MRQLVRCILAAALFGCLSLPALARQVSEWRSTTGNTVQLSGTDQMSFDVFFIQPDGTVISGRGHWIEVRQSFTYEANGNTYYCTFCNDGWGIQVQGPNGTNIWEFVRWIQR
ncbi:MAG: hypothetical protein AB1758_17045 [Candidatus Eremiobacterota bacterium]